MESNVESKSEKKDVDHEAMDEKKYEKIDQVDQEAKSKNKSGKNPSYI